MLRHAFLYVLFWLTVRLVLAQPPSVRGPLPAQIDSLQQLVTTSSSHDSLAVIRLHALARLCFIDLQFTRGLLAAKQAQVLAQQVQYANGEGLYQQTLAVFSYTNSLWLYYDFRFGLTAGKHQQAPPFRDRVGSPLGYPLNMDYAAVNRQLETTLTYFTSRQDAPMMGLILSFISANFRYLREEKESLSYLDRAIQAFRQAKQPLAYYYLLAYKTRLLQGPNQWREAQRVERLVDQFLSSHRNHPETAPIGYQLSWYYVTRNQLIRAFELSTKNKAALERLGDAHLRPFILENLGYIYSTLKVPKTALDYFKQAAWLLEKTNNQSRLAWMYNKVAFTLIALKRFEEARQYITKAKSIHDTTFGSVQPSVDLAQYYDATGQRLMGLGRYQQALPHFFKALQIDSLPGGNGLAFYFDFYIAQCYQKLGNLSASTAYGLKSYQKATLNYSSDGQDITLQSSQLLVENYGRLGQPVAAYPYLKTYYMVRQAMDDQNAANRVTELDIQAIVQKGDLDKNRLEQARLLKERENQDQRWWLLRIGTALVGAFILLGLLYRNNRYKQQANRLLDHQKQEIDRQRGKAEQALRNLKATQAQLIHQEKLASLGELTAGIAHEIQNPLNFVNSFSEVSSELVGELKEEVKAGRTSDVLAIADDLMQNLQRIHHHGGRASAIVRGMLEHSRTETGEKRPINLNALTEEYFKLAYHGVRTKDKDFSCELRIDFDATIGQVEIKPQEIGQVLLNLYNNALYAVAERAKQTGNTAYQPAIAVTTARTNEGVQIRVSDNGTGMSESVLRKIFQPFFTTKPTGEGTGLGLSLSYDIITKGHGGSLSVSSQSGQGTEFVITLPTT